MHEREQHLGRTVVLPIGSRSFSGSKVLAERALEKRVAREKEAFKVTVIPLVDFVELEQLKTDIPQDIEIFD